MQQAQQREIPERISWARAMIFAVGFFFIAAILVGQLPGYVYTMMTAASLQSLEQGMLALAAICFGSFIVIQVIVLLFDPKPVLPPILFTGLGVLLGLGGLALILWAVFTSNQYFPSGNMSIAPVLGGKLLWFQDGNIDFIMLGSVVLGVGVALIFYSLLALREQRNPDRRDLGTTPAIRWMIIFAAVLLIGFMLFYTYYNDNGLAAAWFPHDPSTGLRIIDFVTNCILAVAIFSVLGAFALRLHYLMRPVRKNTMSALYAVGSLGLAQTGAIALIVWFVAYPLITWMHSWTFIGLGGYLTICARSTAIPASCSFAPQAGYIVDAILSTNAFALLMASVWVWKTNRNLVVIGGVVTTAVLALATLLIHTSPDQSLIAMLLCGAILILAAVWTSVARREFAVVGEKNLGCLGMWLVLSTCLFIYLAAFAFFSIPGFHETEPNIPFISGLILPAPAATGQAQITGQADAVLMVVLMGILVAVQFFFLIRNRYRV
ncbi:MAG: hypothetical protein M3Z24_12370 [Chloroflexota bacterium]|nr:hypothetical protein [Chloroflexota bacterium]